MNKCLRSDAASCEPKGKATAFRFVALRGALGLLSCAAVACTTYDVPPSGAGSSVGGSVNNSAGLGVDGSGAGMMTSVVPTQTVGGVPSGGAGGAAPLGGAAVGGGQAPAAAGASGSAGGASVGSPQNCSMAAPPAGAELWLRAGVGLTMEGDRVTAWADQTGGEPAATHGRPAPRAMPNALSGKTVLRFEDGQQGLSRTLAVDGLTGLSIAFVNATPALWKAEPDWCQKNRCGDQPGMGPRGVTETGCSGSYQKVLYWNGQGDWTGIYLSPKQEEVVSIFGNGESWYGDEPCSVAYDSGLGWPRPSSLGTSFSSTIAVHDHLENRLYVHGQQVWSRPAQGCRSELRAGDRLDIGNGFGWADALNRGGDIAEVLVYRRVLTAGEVATLNHYLQCELFAD